MESKGKNWSLIITNCGTILMGIIGIVTLIYLVNETKASTTERERIHREEQTTQHQNRQRLIVHRILQKDEDGMTLDEIRNALRDYNDAQDNEGPKIIHKLTNDDIHVALFQLEEIGLVNFDTTGLYVCTNAGRLDPNFFRQTVIASAKRHLIALVAGQQYFYDRDTLFAKLAEEQATISRPEYEVAMAELCVAFIKTNAAGKYFTPSAAPEGTPVTQETAKPVLPPTVNQPTQ